MEYTLITGAAKRIGYEIAKHLVYHHNHNIILHYYSSSLEAKQAKKELKNKAILCKANLFSEKGIRKLIQYCEKYNINTIIHNASVFENDSIFSKNFSESFQQHIGVNLFARLNIIKELIERKPLHTKNKLNIINILDYGIFMVPHNFFSYHLANKILHSLTEMIARQIGFRGRINNIALGQTMKNDRQSQENFDNTINNTLLGYSSTISDLLLAIDFLLQVQSMTGQTLCLDGGMSILNKKYI